MTLGDGLQLYFSVPTDSYQTSRKSMKPSRSSLSAISTSIHRRQTPSQFLIRFVDLALGLNRGSTLLQLVPEMQAILTSKQKRSASEIAVDVLAAVRRINPLARSSTIAFGRTLEGDGSIRVVRVLKRDGLRGRRGWRDVGEGLHHDGRGDRAVDERDEQGGVQKPEDDEDDAWFEESEVALRRHGGLLPEVGSDKMVGCVSRNERSKMWEEVDCLNWSSKIESGRICN
jgi:hypothetical protein